MKRALAAVGLILSIAPVSGRAQDLPPLDPGASPPLAAQADRQSCTDSVLLDAGTIMAETEKENGTSISDMETPEYWAGYYRQQLADANGDLDTRQREAFDYKIARCLYDGHNYVEAKNVIEQVALNENPSAYDNLGFDLWHDISVAKIWLLLADTYDKLGDKTNAIKTIETLYANIPHDDPDFNTIRSERWRLDEAGIKARQRAAIAKAARDRAQAHAHAQAQARQDLIDSHIYWARLTPDERIAVTQHGGTRNNVHPGEPCHITFSDDALGHWEIWYYFCTSDDGPGSESYTFLDGKLRDHTSY